MRPFSSFLIAAATGLLFLVPATGSAQRAVIGKEVGIGENDASLRLSFADGRTLEVELRDGSVRLNGDRAGTYDEGGALDRSWRALLAEAESLDGDALAARLRAWAAPSGAGPGERDAAARLDQALDSLDAGPARATLAAPDAPVAPAAPGAPIAPQPPRLGAEGALSALLRRPERMVELGRLLDDHALTDADVHVGEDVEVAPGERVLGGLVVVDGDLDVRGEVVGDIVAIGSQVRLAEGGRVVGDIDVADGRVLREGGEVVGDVSVAGGERAGAPARDRAVARARDRGPRFAPLRSFGGRVGDLVGSVFLAFLIAAVGGGLAVHFAREQLEVVAETARANPLRAGTVGLAGAFLTVPTFVIGAVALVITIVGILAVPFWIVLFPIAVCLAAAIGYLGVAQGVGEWIAGRRYARLDWVRASNPYTTVVAGVGALMVGFVAANAIRLFGFLGFLAGLLTACAVVATVAAALIGFGAVLLTRGGRRAPHAHVGWWADDWDDAEGMA